PSPEYGAPGLIDEARYEACEEHHSEDRGQAVVGHACPDRLRASRSPISSGRLRASRSWGYPRSSTCCRSLRAARPSSHSASLIASSRLKRWLRVYPKPVSVLPAHGWSISKLNPSL